jgi:hypothetical protein
VKKWKYMTYLYNLLKKHCPSEALEMFVTSTVSLAIKCVFYSIYGFNIDRYIQNSLFYVFTLLYLTKPALAIP